MTIMIKFINKNITGAIHGEFDNFNLLFEIERGAYSKFEIWNLKLCWKMTNPDRLILRKSISNQRKVNYEQEHGILLLKLKSMQF